MHLTPYLMFPGTCEEAFKLYEKVLGGKILAMLPFAGTESSDNVSPEWKNKIMHAHLMVGEAMLMASDCPPDRYDGAPRGMSVSLHVETPAEAERIFTAFAEQAETITMPLGETFWAQRFGMLTDRFGTPWMINCPKPR